jgi:hypothetical protein
LPCCTVKTVRLISGGSAGTTRGGRPNQSAERSRPPRQADLDAGTDLDHAGLPHRPRPPIGARSSTPDRGQGWP